jgi:hypothetical protein
MTKHRRKHIHRHISKQYVVHVGPGQTIKASNLANVQAKVDFYASMGKHTYIGAAPKQTKYVGMTKTYHFTKERLEMERKPANTKKHGFLEHYNVEKAKRGF